MKLSYLFRRGSRIWSRGGPQLPRPKVADVAKRSRASGASPKRPGSRARLRALEAFGFLMFKYAFSYILGALFSSFWTGSSTSKTNIYSTLHWTSNNPPNVLMLLLALKFAFCWKNYVYDCLMWGGMASAARLEIFLHGSEKYINSVTGDTLFQSKNFSERLQNGNWNFIIDKKSLLHLFSCYKKWKI